MKGPKYINLDRARDVLAEMGIELSIRQIQRAAEPDRNGQRKLPFFVDPIDGRLKINEHKLKAIYFGLDAKAENSMKLEI